MCEDISTGAANDLPRGDPDGPDGWCREWGMSDALGLVAFGPPARFIGDDPMAPEWSERTADLVDSEVARILREQEERTRQLLTSHADVVGRPRRALVEHETLDADAVSRSNQMAVVEAWTPAGMALIDGVGYEPTAAVVLSNPEVEGQIERLSLAATRCSAGYAFDDGGVWRAHGDPMEAALDAFRAPVGRRHGCRPGPGASSMPGSRSTRDVGACRW